MVRVPSSWPSQLHGDASKPWQDSPGIAADRFREIMAALPSSVSVVTARDGNLLWGLTVSAFCPVCLSPPLVLVCVDKRSKTLSGIMRSHGFTVNVLAAGREGLALRFASKAEGKFEAVEWQSARTPEGGPILWTDAAAVVVCRLFRAIEAGDHWILLGEVLDGAVHAGREPLVYCHRAYGRVSERDSS
jgi:flavin reductase (DIM6/NTAB) family NADH-FMN oxidoreductase RutF